MNNDFIENLVASIAVFFVLVLLIATLWGAMALSSIYSVWSKGKSGEASLKEAEWTRQIVVKEAQAKLDSAHLLADAEIERAKGVASANKIIGDSLKENEAYLRYLWIDSLQHTQDKIIYIPTEAGLPILEAGRK